MVREDRMHDRMHDPDYENYPSGHKPTPKSHRFSDWVECACGWESQEYWDGEEYAFSEWQKHIKAGKAEPTNGA